MIASLMKFFVNFISREIEKSMRKRFASVFEYLKTTERAVKMLAIRVS